MPFKYSKAVRSISDAKSITINQKVYELQRSGHNPIIFSSGEAFFDLDLYSFNKVGVKEGFHYSDTQGIPALREKMAKFYNSSYSSNITANEIIISPGSKFSIFAVFKTILDNSDEVLMHEPCWLSYKYQVELAGGLAKSIPYDADLKQVTKYFTQKTKILAICNPNNPAGRIYSKDEILFLKNTCQEHNVYLLVDEAYSDFTSAKFHSLYSYENGEKEGLIVVNSLSKNMGMSGWRIGYSIATQEFNSYMLKINQHLVTCAPTLLLRYTNYYFHDILKNTLPQVAEITKKRENVKRYLDEIGLNYLSGEGTFYFMIDISNFNGDDVVFSDLLLKQHRIAVVPGSAYGDSTRHFVRVGIGTETLERIFEGLRILKYYL